MTMKHQVWGKKISG